MDLVMIAFVFETDKSGYWVMDNTRFDCGCLWVGMWVRVCVKVCVGARVCDLIEGRRNNKSEYYVIAISMILHLSQINRNKNALK